MDIALLVFLILLNALFAMSEMALTASRKARLQVMVEAGEAGAQVAIELHDNPTKFLAVVQVGITSIAILNGIVGDAAFSAPLAVWLHGQFELSERAAHITATALVVLIITIATIIFGELVPKRLGQLYPETVARMIAPAMNGLAVITRPFVRLLSACTDATLRLMGVRPGAARSVTEEEIAASLEEGLDAGIIEAQEHQMVRNVFRLDERQVGSMMIPRTDIAWLDTSARSEEVLKVMAETDHSRYPVCRGGLDDVLGVISSQTLLQQVMKRGSFTLTEDLQQPVFVPETLSGMELLEHFRSSGAELVSVSGMTDPLCSSWFGGQDESGTWLHTGAGGWLSWTNFSPSSDVWRSRASVLSGSFTLLFTLQVTSA